MGYLTKLDQRMNQSRAVVVLLMLALAIDLEVHLVKIIPIANVAVAKMTKILTLINLKIQSIQ
jgi:hypothetical protein